MNETETMTADEKGYNGWKNYETWCVNLWLSNDEGMYRATQEVVDAAREAWDEGGFRSLDGEVADALKDFVEELPEYASVREQASFVSDLLGAALSEVDWYEIAAAWLSGD